MLFLKAILSHLYLTLLPQVSGRQQTDCAGAHHGNLTPPRISPSCPHCLWLWLDRSIIIRLLTRVGPVSLAAMRNSPPQAAFWTDGYRSAPFSAVFDAGICTGGLGASSSVALALSQGPLVSGRIPLPDLRFSRLPGPAFGRHPVPSRFPASKPVPLNCVHRNMALGDLSLP